MSADKRAPVIIAGHRVRWYVWGDGPQGPHLIPHNPQMRGTWGWDAVCECGWRSRTGGATRGSVEKTVWRHKFYEADEAGRARLAEVVR